MNTYFTQANVMKRFFFVTGKTKDSFVDETLAIKNIEYMLFDHLKELGYERVLFYSKTQKLFCYDEESYRLVMNYEAGGTKQSPARIPGIVKGPLKGSLLCQKVSGEGASSGKTLPSGVLHFGKMSELDAFKKIDYCMNDKRCRTAVVFNNAEDFMTFFGQVRTNRGSESIQSKIYDSINNYEGLPFDNSNIMIFVFPQRTLSETLKVYGDMSGLWNTFFQPKLKKYNVIEIGAPSCHEIRNAINLIRLEYSLKVDLRNIEIISQMLAKRAFADKQSLTELMRALMNLAGKKQKLDLSTAEVICGTNDKRDALSCLNKLIGMDTVKQHVYGLVKRAEHREAEKDYGYSSRILPQPKPDRAGMNLHLVLTGNPGTGKTTVARLLGDIYYELGFLPGGHTIKVTRSDLVAGYVGQTAIKTRECIDRAMGGVLFVDEAYTLKRVQEGALDNDFGQEAIDTILEAMSDKAGEFAVVVAGYPKEMQGFLSSNPGLQRRFGGQIHIEDYSPEELIEIFKMNCQSNKYAIEESMDEQLSVFFNNWHRSRDDNWGNAGSVEMLMDSMYENWCMRSGDKAIDGRAIFSREDVPAELQKHFESLTEVKRDSISQLESLVGLGNVKERIKKIRRNIKIGGKVNEPGHYIFAGNPGTGKTTVARLLGDLLCEAGVLRRGHVVEVSREELVASHVGATAQKTRKVIEKAMDGVLFIDEAYRLADGGGGSANNFGLEAIDTLVAAMENNRERLCVICAGYTGPMKTFVQCNPGLKSRFTEIIDFEDYTSKELVQILKSFAGNDAVLDSEFLRKSENVFEYWIANKTSNFGNARDVRKYFAQCQDTLFARLEEEYPDYDIPEEKKRTYTSEDVPKTYELDIAVGVR